MTGEPTIRAKDRDAIVQSLRAGVVPRIGQQHIQVGRAAEIEAVLSDINRITDGGSSIRFVVGDYGSGKTFLLNLLRSIALEKRLVTASADLNPDRRLHATGGQARSLYGELMRNLATRGQPDGGAMAAVVQRFATTASSEARDSGQTTTAVVHDRLNRLSELLGGYDFAQVVEAYWRGYETDKESLQSDAIRWLRGEYATRTDARMALGVRTIIDDANFYDSLKLFAYLVRLAGYGGLLVTLDELVNIYKLANTQARNANYEQILRMLNDALQGNAAGLGFLLGGTPEFLMDNRKGLYSYPALESRLAENSYATGGLVDYSGPVLRLSSLSPEDLFILLGKLRDVYAYGDKTRYLIPDEAIPAFMRHCSQRIGDAYFRTPRTTIRSFINLLAVLEQNPGSNWETLLGQIDVVADQEPDIPSIEDAEGGPDEDSSGLVGFRL